MNSNDPKPLGDLEEEEECQIHPHGLEEVKCLHRTIFHHGLIKETKWRWLRIKPDKR
jgi:hypothetical protein